MLNCLFKNSNGLLMIKLNIIVTSVPQNNTH